MRSLATNPIASGPPTASQKHANTMALSRALTGAGGGGRANAPMEEVAGAQDTIYLCNFRVSVDGEWLCLKELQDLDVQDGIAAGGGGGGGANGVGGVDAHGRTIGHHSGSSGSASTGHHGDDGGGNMINYGITEC